MAQSAKAREEFIPCRLKSPPRSEMIAAAARAIAINPANRPLLPATPDQLVALTAKYWGAGGVRLTVDVIDSTASDIKNKILGHMNAWGQWGNVVFVLDPVDPQVRIAREGTDLWSYLGVDILSIPRSEATMNLGGFTMRTSDAECKRVIPHETGHTAGFPHEHLRAEIIEKLDRGRTIAWGRSYLGWSEQAVIHNILTPLSAGSVMGSPNADEDSVMCYQLPGSITKDGKPIRGGLVISPTDAEAVAKLYPKATPPPPPPEHGDWWEVNSENFQGWMRSRAKPIVTPYSE